VRRRSASSSTGQTFCRHELKKGAQNVRKTRAQSAPEAYKTRAQSAQMRAVFDGFSTVLRIKEDGNTARWRIEA
jgi:hypothetical protein